MNFSKLGVLKGANFQKNWFKQIVIIGCNVEIIGFWGVDLLSNYLCLSLPL